MHPYKRSDRVGDLLREEIADIVMYRLKDPRLGFITVTGVEVTADLKLARVFVSTLQTEERETALDILNAARSFIHSHLRKRLKMKFIPKLEFRIDTSIEYGFRMDRLLKDISSPEDGAGGAESEGGPEQQ